MPQESAKLPFSEENDPNRYGKDNALVKLVVGTEATIDSDGVCSFLVRLDDTDSDLWTTQALTYAEITSRIISIH